MTTICAIEHDGIVTMGGDSLLSDGGSCMLLDRPKIFVVGPYLIGPCGDSRMADILEYEWEPEPITGDVHRHIVKSVVPQLRALFREHGFAGEQCPNHPPSESDLGGAFLIAARGRVYAIDDTFSVSRNPNGFNAVGNGGPVAIGSLATSVGLSASDRIYFALEVSEHYAMGVRAPFAIVEHCV